MKMHYISILVLLLCTNAIAQSDLQQLFDTEKAFERAAAENGAKPAYLKFLADDSVVFRPDAVNGKEFWKAREDLPGELLSRNATFIDIAANGLLGYSTGNWELFPKGRTGLPTKFGQFVTIWEKKPDGKFRASVDISVTHEKFSGSESSRVVPTDKNRDLNKHGRSAADPSMNFLRTSMSKPALSGAYKKFAAKDVRLLLDQAPPITGKKNVVGETKPYTSISFPKKIALYESADMAYVWNACEFANSSEGTEKGNCLHIWKLRNKKWWIVLGVFARIPNETEPTLKIREKSKKP